MHVLTVGSGIGGITLTHSLRKQGNSAEIFERDVRENGHFQAWAVTLHTYESTRLAGIEVWKEARVAFSDIRIVSSWSMCPFYRRICMT